MSTINRTALLPYSAEQMFDLVNDVAAYPEFLSWCSTVQVVSRNQHSLEATIALSGGQTFTTRNTMEAGRRIDMTLVKGPFRHLKGAWLFQPIGTHGCQISLHMEFDLAKGLVGLTFGKVFNQLANSMVDAFCRRAVQRYGKP